MVEQDTAQPVLLALLTLGLLALSACGEPPDLPPAGAKGGIIHLWRGGVAKPTEIRCRQVLQDGPRPDAMQLHGLRVAMPLQDGLLYLEAEQGAYRATSPEPLVLEPPVRLHGWLAGSACTGTAQGMQVVAGGDDLLLTGVSLVHAGQHQT
ncbi:MAG: hypothetical protein PF961_15600, partial [Planctomycetota bacterium]|nr:hypothetical protein [Planctomycetota bacterium]